jgi:uncharacterized membrane protein
MMPGDTTSAMQPAAKHHFFRFHARHEHLASMYGDDWFALKAEAFARFFGTPTFIVIQTIIVGIWIIINAAGLASFDLYPFILLNLAFSLQAAYAAPLILLAQTRQADRDKAHAEADAEHREDIARANAQRQTLITNQTAILVDMLNQNTQLTESIKELTERLETLTLEVHQRLAPPTERGDNVRVAG